MKVRSLVLDFGFGEGFRLLLMESNQVTHVAFNARFMVDALYSVVPKKKDSKLVLPLLSLLFGAVEDAP